MTTRYSGEAFKRSVIHYACGRIFNAVAAFLIFVWVARQLPQGEYANYVAAFALLEIGLVLSSIGMEWVTAVYVPQFRLNASGRALRRFVGECAVIQAAALMLGAGVLFVSAPWLSNWFGLIGAEGGFRIYAVVMFIEGMSRVFRDQLLACLLLQGPAQISQFARNLTLLVAVIWIFADERARNVEGLAMAEVAASTVSLVLACGLLCRYLTKVNNDPAVKSGWAMPRWPAMFKVARNAWVSNLANLTWCWSAVVLLVARTMGVETTSALGFARNLAEQIRRYMPTEFLFGIVRTLLIGRFSQDGDARSLGVRIGLMYKANLLFLVPLLIATITHGDEICALLSGGRYSSSAHWFLVGWLCVLVALAHRRLTDLLAHALGRSALTARASLLLTGTPVAILASAQLANWALLFFVLLSAEIIYSTIVILRLRLPSWSYAPDWIGLGKIALAAALAAWALYWVPAGVSHWPAIVAVGLAYGVIWATVWLLRVWTRQETMILSTRLRRWALIEREK